MNNAMLAFLGIPEILVIFLVLLGMAGMAVAAALLLVWLLRRNEAKPEANAPNREEVLAPHKPAASCPRCGTALPANSPQGLCPRCVMGVGLATETEATGEFGSHGTKIVPPPEADVARRFPHLEILGCLGHGGMGVVYRARQPKLNRLVALKILAPEKGADPRFAERFLREAQALARLSHPNIVTVHDFGEADGMFFLLMEYVDGMTLRQLLREGRMKPEQALEIVPPICEALQFAHEQGVVHRDIKPENVLLDKQGRVKIADFGIAKLVGGTPLFPSDGERVPARTGEGCLTQDQVLGTPQYMAPEQIEKPQTVDHRADIYSLGVVFYEMLTGELPLGKFQPPSKKVQVDVRLDEVVLHALEKEPERRYQHASEVKTDVETIASGAAAPMNASASAKAGQEVKAPARWLVATGILNWIAVPFIVFVIASVRSQTLQPDSPMLLPLLAVLFLSGAIILAGLKMRRLEGYSLAILGSILAIFITPGNIIGLPVGIWSLVVLLRRDVREAFEQRHPTAPPAPADPAQPLGETATIEQARRLVRRPALGLITLSLLSPFMLAAMVASGHLKVGAWMLFPLILELALVAVSALGGFSLLHLQSRRMAVAGGIAGCALSFFNFLCLPFAVWALAVARRREVREAFEAPRTWNAKASPKASSRGLAWGMGLGLASVALLAGMLATVLPHGPRLPNTMVTGVVTDAATGRPIGGVRVADLLYAGSPSREPQAVWTDGQGRFALPTWYEEHTIAASASGYQTALAMLLTKPLGSEREVKMDFQLQPTNLTAAASSAKAGALEANGEVLQIQLRQAEAEVVRLKKLSDAKLASASELQAALDKAEVLRARLNGDPVSAAAVNLAAAERRLQQVSELRSSNLASARELEVAETEVLVRHTELRAAQAARGTAAGGPRKFVRLVVEANAMTFEGQPTTWDNLGALVANVPDRTNTVLEMAVTSDQITVAQQNEWFHKAGALARQHGFEYASFIGIHPLGSKGSAVSP